MPQKIIKVFLHENVAKMTTRREDGKTPANSGDDTDYIDYS